MTDKDENLLGSKVFSEPDPTLSVAEREAAEKEIEDGAAKEAAQEEEAVAARARFLGIAPLVGVEPEPESIHQNDAEIQPSPVGLSADHRAAAKGEKPAKAAPKKAAPRSAAGKAKAAGNKKAAAARASAAAASAAERESLRTSTMPGAPRSDGG
jgi:hypothetical protein